MLPPSYDNRTIPLATAAERLGQRPADVLRRARWITIVLRRQGDSWFLNANQVSLLAKVFARQPVLPSKNVA